MFSQNVDELAGGAAVTTPCRAQDAAGFHVSQRADADSSSFILKYCIRERGLGLGPTASAA